MVHFVLQADCQQPLGLEFKGLTMNVVGANADEIGPAHLIKNAWNRQAAFLMSNPLIGSLLNDRINENF